ncbi:hypothetical protein SPRG_07137 [Saprolegnia parasitica CBS 223.65]|uniref:Uncharacterized protein n=1 Tax=Saprolegnia parasitica (strain CBS 223.65) TaxID=695850 RepID=A0A067CAS2_SAPPC|nr:hypothetical protein SPRG_07137 [Saprolegnia parasitica CBS 223.65]KDO27864.1 hypothetical protein SPRG_07137 [Saprolegnia parasitica CBS 223.65]|eukprot:XP_012201324.1 hypothetical protein SPRG_07137 [Saprolegnia parasitica CBS 223.65]
MWSSAVSGAIAACSGMLGKFSSDDSTSMLHGVQETCMSMAVEVPWLDCAYVSVGVRVLFFVAMLLSNAVMLNFFVQGLHETDSLTATITSSAINFVVTAVLGLAIFHEHLPLQWWLGASIILLGMGCLLYGDKATTKTKDE